MADFKCPHCGEHIHMKVTLKDVTKSHAIQKGNLDSGVVDSILKSYGAKESPRSESKLTSKLQKSSNPLTQFFGEVLEQPVQDSMKYGSTPRDREEMYGDDDDYRDEILSKDKVKAGQSIADKMNAIFGKG